MISLLSKSTQDVFLPMGRRALLSPQNSSHLLTKFSPKFPPYLHPYQTKSFSKLASLQPKGNSVKNIKKIGLYLILGGVAVTSLGLYAKEKNKFSLTPSSTPLVLSSIQGKQLAEAYIQRYPEIGWLADSGVRKTEEGQATLKGTYSELVYGEQYPELNRTLTGLYCLQLVFKGDEAAYQLFTEAQSAHKLSRESFHALHMQAQKLLKSKWHGLSESQIATALETALTLSDMGKGPGARKLFQLFDINVPDHDDFYEEVMNKVLKKHPHLCPSFASLPPTLQELLIKIAGKTHYGHVTHLEGGIDMFSKLKESLIPVEDPLALDFELLLQLGDVMGARGHVTIKGSVVYTETTHWAMQAMIEGVKVLCDPCKSELDAYNRCLEIRAARLGLNPKDSSDRVLVRIAAMLRLFFVEEGLVLKSAMNQFPPSIRQSISEQLDVQEHAQQGRTPTYIPALLINLSENLELGASKDERLRNAITIGLPFIARVLAKHKEMLRNHEIDPLIPLNFNTMAGVAKTHPGSLEKEFEINETEGTILLCP